MTIEGASTEEADGDAIVAGDELIDVGLYFGAEELAAARLVRYIQLKHSTRQTLEAWTASGLTKTIKGFAKRYAELVGRFSIDDVESRFTFEFTTNRPIDPKLKEAIAELAPAPAAPRLRAPTCRHFGDNMQA